MRLFIAIEVSEEIKAELKKVVDKLKEVDADVKWVRKEGLHITLKFLGEVDENGMDKIVNILEQISGEKNPFTVSFKGLGAFSDLKRPRVIWVGIERGKEELKDIAKELDVREFSPHLTLGRVKSGRNRNELASALTDQNNLTMPELNVTKINLMESILKREGAEYRKRREIWLKKKKGM